MWISKQRHRYFERASREVIADPKVCVQAGVVMFWVHHDSVTQKACFHACAPHCLAIPTVSRKNVFYRVILTFGDSSSE
jgi:hypothetical protein